MPWSTLGLFGVLTLWAALGVAPALAALIATRGRALAALPIAIAPDVRTRFLGEMADVAEAVFRAFEPRKLNYELLGNSVAHLHWHIFPRYAGDPNPRWPVWSNGEFLQAPRRTDIAPAALAEVRERVQRALADVRGALR